MPSAEDKKLLLEIIANERNGSPKEGGRDPLETIADPENQPLTCNKFVGRVSDRPGRAIAV